MARERSVTVIWSETAGQIQSDTGTSSYYCSFLVFLLDRRANTTEPILRRVTDRIGM